MLPKMNKDVMFIVMDYTIQASFKSLPIEFHTVQ